MTSRPLEDANCRPLCPLANFSPIREPPSLRNVVWRHHIDSGSGDVLLEFVGLSFELVGVSQQGFLVGPERHALGDLPEFGRLLAVILDLGLPDSGEGHLAVIASCRPYATLCTVSTVEDIPDGRWRLRHG